MISFIAMFVLSLALSACSEKVLETEVNNVGSLEGTVVAATAALSSANSDVYSLACSAWTAKLYELSGTDDSVEASPLLTTTVASDGKFKFERLSSVQVRLKDQTSLQYVVVIEGCGKKFRRPITSNKDQDITPTTDIILRAFRLLSINGRSPQQISVSAIGDLISHLETFQLSTLNDVYTKLITDSASASLFNAAFGFSAADLQYLPPDIQLGLNPATASEGTTPTFLLSLTHWYPGYPKRALWYSGSTYLGEGETASLPITKNLQGNRTVSVKAGYSTGATSIDLAKPFSEASISLSVDNTYPATAPILTRTIPATTIATTRTLTLSLNTGAALANCDTFSALALTEENFVPPLSTSDFNITCSSAPAQSIPFVLATAGEGVKTLRLWAIDSSGNVSAASTLLVPLDTVTPNAPTLTLLSSAFSNSTTVQIQNTDCNDSATHILFSESNTTPALNAAGWVACSASNYNVTVSSGDGAKTIYAFLKDSADHISTHSNVTMTLDTTNPAISLTGAPTLNQRLKGSTSTTLTWTATDTNLTTTPITLELSTNSGTTWAALGSAISNSGSYSWTIPNYTGTTFQVRAKATDKAGNVGTTSASPNFAIDSTSPNVTLTSITGGQFLKGASTVAVTWSATDELLAANPISIDLSANGGSTWSSVATGLANSGTYTWTVPSVDGINYRIRVTAVDAVGWTSSSQSASSFLIDSTAPAITLLSLTGGQTIPGAQNYTIAWTATDARLTTSPISIDYSNDAGSTWTAIASGLANSGSYTWSVAVADGVQYRVRVRALDQVGNIGTSASASNFAISSSAPNLTQTTAAGTIISKTLSQVTYGGACQTGLNVTVSGAETGSFACPTGTWSWTTATYATDAVRSFTFTQTNALPLTTTVSVSWTRDTVAPALSAVVLNSGDATTAIPQVNAEVTSLESNIQVRLGLAEAGTGSCQAVYADNNWESHSALVAVHLYSMPVGDGLKKVCVWTKDAASNISVFSPVTGTAGVNNDSINLEAGTPPVITAFSVVNDSTGGTVHSIGDRLKISWSITDIEGLHNNPVKLDYSTDNGVTWTAIVTNFGGLSGNPTSYTYDYFAFNAPTTGVFRVRIRVADAAGNSASPVISNVQNGGRWTVYAGNTDKGIGGEAKSLRWKTNWSGQFNVFAINPLNGDIYVIHESNQVIKMDRSSGLTSVFLTSGPVNLPDNGATPATPLAPFQAFSRIAFDNNGKFYFLASITGSATNSSTIYQFDLVQNTVRRYLGPGNIFDGTATPSTVHVSGLGFSFDSSNTLYFATNCAPGPLSASTTMRIMKATQNSDGTAGTVSVLAGNCTRGTPTSGNTALTEPLTTQNTDGQAMYGKIAANADGSIVYFRMYTDQMKRIIDGKIYNSNVTHNTTDFMFDNANNRIIQSYAGDVAAWSVNATGNGTEVKTTLATSNGSDADCWNDGKPALQACLNSQISAMVGPDRLIYFVDNVASGGGIARVRYIDGNNTIRTAVGGKPVYGEGLSRDLVKTDFSSIYYKQASEGNQAAFPAGLYFTSYTGFVFGYLDDNTNMSVIWGSQKIPASPVSWTDGTSVTPALTIGVNSFTGQYLFNFDSTGLPLFRLNDTFLSLDATKKIVNRSVRSTPGYSDYWEDAANGDQAKKYGAAAYIGYRNLPIKKNQGIFIVGRSYIPSIGRNAQEPLLRYHDFTADLVQHIMGGTGLTANADSVTPGSLAGATLSSTYCLNSVSSCALQFEENDPNITSDDVLYIAEGHFFRKILDPLTPANNYLTTVFNAGGTIQNYILSQDKKYVFYIRNSVLYCHSFTVGDELSWCKNNPAQHSILGPPTGMSNLAITNGSAFTWRSPTRLLINTSRGEIYEFNTAP